MYVDTFLIIEVQYSFVLKNSNVHFEVVNWI